MKKRRYLLCSDLLSGGGAEKVLAAIASFLAQQRHAVTIVTDQGSAAECRRLCHRRVRYFCRQFKWLPEVRRFSPQWLFQRCRYTIFCLQQIWLRHAKYDTAIAMKEGPSMQAVAAMAVRQKFAWIHVDFQYLHWSCDYFPSPEAERQCMMSFDKVICVSEATAQSVRRTIGDPGNLQVCYNPIPVHTILNLAQEPPVLQKSERPLFVAVGRLSEEKQYTLLLNAVARLAEQHDFDLWIIGDGPQRQILKNIIQNKHLSHVTLVGKLDNPYPLVKQADCFVSTSKAESYGLAIQEALLLGVPVLTTACPAMYEVVDNRCGLIVPNDEDSLTSAMEALLRQPGQLETMRDSIKTCYDPSGLWNNRLRKIYQVLEKENAL